MTEEKKEMRKPPKVIKMEMRDIIAWNNDLYAASREPGLTSGKIVYWIGYQMGKLRPFRTQFIEAMQDDKIKAYEKARAMAKNSEELLRVEDANMEVVAMLTAINDEEYEVSVRQFSPDWLEESASIPLSLSRAISYADLE
jgi:hypothetical protein